MSVLRSFYFTMCDLAGKIAGRCPWIVNGFLYRLTYLKAISRRGFERRTIVTHPHRPRTYHSLYKVAHILGYRLTTDLRADAVAYVAFQDATVKERDDKLAELASNRPVINIDCNDISKKHVAAAFEKVFGYTLTLNPCTFTGECVKKSNYNGKHDGVIITCPIQEEGEDREYIYQRVVNNGIAGSDLLLDLRVPIYNESIPFVVLKYRDPNSRFNHCIRAVTVNVDDVLSPDEVDKTHAMCREIGLNLGELDILRDMDDGRIYVVDVNDTPTGPVGFHRRDRRALLERMATAFERTFLEAGTD